MHSLVSRENDKLGSIPNTSLPPGLSCVPGVPCCSSRRCYAIKHAYRRFPHVKVGWDDNFRKLTETPGLYFDEILTYLKRYRPRRFRIHVGGDFMSQDHFDRWIAVARKARRTKFVAFTKNYALDFSGRPKNLSILLSRWPTLAVPATIDLAKFAQVMYYDKNYQLELWNAYTPEDVRKPVRAKVCPGSCRNCWWCWNAKPGDMIMLPKH